MIKSKISILFIGLFSIIYACKQEKTKEKIIKINSSIVYAENFDIQTYNNYKKLIIKAPYPGAKEVSEYLLIPKGKKIPKEFIGQHIIRTPIEKIVLTSTTHIPFLELLHQENSLVGYPNTKYISSKKTRKLIEKGAIKELGNEQNINIEILLDLQPEVLIGFALNSNTKMFSTIEKSGIPVIFNSDWLEKTPLGRAEWIKFFAVLYDKESEANQIFTHIEKEYQNAVNIAKKAITKPTVLSGSIFKDIWNLPAGESFMAQFFKDANTSYLWTNSKGKGSLSLNFESVFEKGRNADLWIDTGMYTRFKGLQNANLHYTKFKPFQTKKIYSFAHRKGENGGLLYYELAPAQPHIVLKDIIKVAHPELFPDYIPFFLEQLK